jgi:hypothetical protein
MKTYQKPGEKNAPLQDVEDKLEERAEQDFAAQIEEQCKAGKAGKHRPATKILKEWEDYGVGLIDRWDVRCVGKLIELFPSCVPAHWQGKRLVAEIMDNENCDWVVGPAQ